MPMLLEVRPPDQPEVTLHNEGKEQLDALELESAESNQVLEEEFTEELTIRLEDYYRHVPVASIHTTCAEAAAMLNEDHSHPCIVLCDDQMKPIGMLMREALYRLLNGRFAADLFYRKPIVHVVNTSPVVVDVQMEATAIIDIALGRDEKYFYDCLLVTEKERLLGVLTMRDVMSLSRKLQQGASADRILTLTGSRQEVSRINEAVTKLVDAANQTVQEASGIMALSTRGEDSLRQVEVSYRQVNEHMQSQRKHADQMLESIKKGTGMARSIRSLADQSGLLALNASIEAAHAGEYGRGFQIVAGEIRALAQQTREVTENMSSLLEGIGELTHQTVALIKSSGSEIDDSLVHVTEGTDSFGHLNQSVKGLSSIVESIALEGSVAGKVAENIQLKLMAMISDHPESDEWNQI